MNKNRGFTLIELLVVIAIIGILASVILVSLNSAREKAKDVKVVSGVKQLKTIIESNYSGVTYPDLTNDNNKLFGGLVADSNPGSSTITALLADVSTQGGAINVVNDPATEGEAVLDYAIYGQLISSTTQYFCIDSKGSTNQATINNTTATCPQ